MRKWLRRTLIAALFVGLTLAALYEAATHVGRGWLRGEAFYEGRPTSYWCARIDAWLERLASPDEAVGSINLREDRFGFADSHIDRCEAAVQFSPAPLTPLPQTWSRQFFSLWRSKSDIVFDEHLPPRVLFYSTEAEAVLLEMARETKYHAITEQALKNVRLLRSIKEAGKTPKHFLGNTW